MMLDRRQTLLAGLGLLAAPTAALAQTPAPAPAAPPALPIGWATVDRLAGEAITRGALPGLAVVASRDGKIVHAKGYGLANIETNTPVTPDTIFRIGSVTKQFTGATILKLADEGKLSLDDTLARFLPDFPRAGDVTIRRMLNHTSGLGNYTNYPSEAAFYAAGRPYRDQAALLKEMVDATKPMFVFEPGAAWAYSNTAYVLLGVIIEKASGQSVAAGMKQRLFAPLGLKHTAFDDAADVVPGRASGYAPNTVTGQGWRNAPFIDMTFPGAAGSIRSSALDLILWHAALYGGKVLKPDAFTAMHTPGLTNDGKLPQSFGAPAGAPPQKYGFGQGIADVEGKIAYSHSGGINGFVSYLVTMPDERITLAVLTNTDDDGPSAPLREIRRQALRAARA